MGLVASPGKSLFLYSPIVVLGAVPLFAHPPQGRRRLDVAWPLALLALFVVTYALARGELWWGGTGWGPRYMVPLSPFLVVAAAPALDYALRAGASWVARDRAGPAVRPSLPGAGGGRDRLSAGLLRRVGARGLGEGAAWTVGLWNPNFSAILTHLRLLATGLPDFAWARARAAGPDWYTAILIGRWLRCGFAAAVWAWGARASVTRRAAWLAAAAR